MLDDLGIGGLQCRIAYQPAGGMLEIGGGQRFDTVAHGGQSEVGTVGDQGGEQCPIGICPARLVAGERSEGAGESAAPIDIQQDVFEPDPGHATLDRPAQGPQISGHGEPIRAAQPLIEKILAAT